MQLGFLCGPRRYADAGLIAAVEMTNAALQLA
jgi:hypothetical protein